MSFVTFPGAAGNYASTPDVNLLDADTAHMVQSNPFLTSPVRCTAEQEPDTADGFGVTKFTVTDASAACRVQAEGLSIPYTGTALGLGVSLTADPGNSGTATVYMNVDGKGPTATVDPGETVWLSGTRSDFDSEINTVYVGALSGGTIVGDSFTFTGLIVTEGTDIPAAFVPSLRIVGDLDITMDIDAPDPAATKAFYLKGEFGNALFGVWSSGSNIRYRGSRDGGNDVDAIAAGTQWGSRTVFRFFDELGAGTAPILITQDGNPIYDVTQGGSGTSRTQNAFAATAMSDRVGGNNAAGSLYEMTLRDGIDGPIVAQFDAADVGGVL